MRICAPLAEVLEGCQDVYRTSPGASGHLRSMALAGLLLFWKEFLRAPQRGNPQAPTPRHPSALCYAKNRPIYDLTGVKPRDHEVNMC